MNPFHGLDGDDQRKGWRIALITILVLGAGLGLRDPWPPDEPALALMAKTMADSGEWLIPFLGGEPFAGHPPFAVWLMAAFYDTTGSLRLSFLLPSLLASLGTLWLVYDLARQLWGARTGRLAAMALLCSFQFMLQAHRGQVDAILMFWATLALYGFLQYILLENSRRWLQVAGAAIGMGVLTKGVGYLPALILLPWAWMRHQGWQALPAGRNLRQCWLAGLTALILVLAWALPTLGFVSGADDQALDRFRRELLINLAGGADLLPGASDRAWWYLPLQALLLWLPLTLLLPWKIRVWRDRLRARDPVIGLLLGYILLVLAFFSLLPGKHGVQLLIVLPAVALLMAPYLGGLWWRPGVQRVSVACLWLASLCLLAVFFFSDEVLLWWHQQRPAADIPDLLWQFLGVLGTLGLAISVAMRGQSRALGLPVFFFAGWLLLGFWAYPSLNTLRTPAPMMAAVEARMAPEDQLAVLAWRPQIELFARRPVRRLDRAGSEWETQAAAAQWLQQSSSHWLIGPLDDLENLPMATEIHVLDIRHRVNWALARAR